jgi:hypothetical protein
MATLLSMAAAARLTHSAGMAASLPNCIKPTTGELGGSVGTRTHRTQLRLKLKHNFSCVSESSGLAVFFIAN